MGQRKWLWVILLGLLVGASLSGGGAGRVAAEAAELPCWPGTGTTPAPPYPARTYLPLTVAPTSGGCGLEVEANDTHTAAQALSATCVAATAASSGDSDWYALRVCAPVTLTFRTTGAPQSALDLDLYLHAQPPGVPLAASEGLGVNETVTRRVAAGTYYALGQPAAGSGAYTLWLEVQR